MSPTLADGFFTTEPPGQSHSMSFKKYRREIILPLAAPWLTLNLGGVTQVLGALLFSPSQTSRVL